MLSYRTQLPTPARPETVWDVLHSGELVAILFNQRVRKAQLLEGSPNHVGARYRYDLMTEQHDTTGSLLAELVAQTPYRFVHWRYSVFGATYLLKVDWQPTATGSELQVYLETNYASPFLTLGLLFRRRRYYHGWDERFAELAQYLAGQYPTPGAAPVSAQ